ncbi:hypothetical protein HanHA300_Chr15g0567141 [Helianthus annuus]|nr:hypothetical protein HanHA300_Chr15g0567141 [Helianthus annuus]KAJ0473278.1 hypothetical protein HanHA89_Chr15g0616481 [Helianthus annuus]
MGNPPACGNRTQEEVVLIEGKVDWKGRPATKNKHGGMRAALPVLETGQKYFWTNVSPKTCRKHDSFLVV